MIHEKNVDGMQNINDLQ